MKGDMVNIYLVGKKYQVPAGSTIMGAMEYAGFQLKRGVGCREGFCGACAAVYRLPKDYKIHADLACQTVVEEGMYIAQIPFVPTVKPIYNLDEVTPSVGTFQQLYPEVFRCVSCNTCTKSCPQDINVMEYINCVEQGNMERAAELSYDCIRCGLCALRCPAEIGQFNVANLAQRLYAKYLVPRTGQVKKRVEEIVYGKFNDEMQKMKTLSFEELKKKYYERDIEPGEKA